MESLEKRELVSFLVSCSRQTLAEFYLKRLNRVANLERQFRDLAREIVENLAHVELADLLRDHGEEIVGHPTEELKLTAATAQAQLSIPPKAVGATAAPRTLYRWIWKDPSLSKAQKSILQVITNHHVFGRPDARHEGWARVSCSQIGSETGFSRRHVIRVCKDLVAMGRLEIDQENWGGRGHWMRVIPNQILAFGRSDTMSHQECQYVTPREQLRDDTGSHQVCQRVTPGVTPSHPLSVLSVLPGEAPPPTPPQAGGAPSGSALAMSQPQPQTQPLGLRKNRRNAAAYVGTGPDPRAVGATVNPEVLERNRRREEHGK